MRHNLTIPIIYNIHIYIQMQTQAQILIHNLYKQRRQKYIANKFKQLRIQLIQHLKHNVSINTNVNTDMNMNKQCKMYGNGTCIDTVDKICNDANMNGNVNGNVSRVYKLRQIVYAYLNICNKMDIKQQHNNTHIQNTVQISSLDIYSQFVQQLKNIKAYNNSEQHNNNSIYENQIRSLLQQVTNMTVDILQSNNSNTGIQNQNNQQDIQCGDDSMQQQQMQDMCMDDQYRYACVYSCMLMAYVHVVDDWSNHYDSSNNSSKQQQLQLYHSICYTLYLIAQINEYNLTAIAYQLLLYIYNVYPCLLIHIHTNTNTHKHTHTNTNRSKHCNKLIQILPELVQQLPSLQPQSINSYHNMRTGMQLYDTLSTTTPTQYEHTQYDHIYQLLSCIIYYVHIDILHAWVNCAMGDLLECQCGSLIVVLINRFKCQAERDEQYRQIYTAITHKWEEYQAQHQQNYRYTQTDMQDMEHTGL